MSEERKLRIHPGIRTRARELRHPQTPAESALWREIRNGQLRGYKFRRQHPIGMFIVDFYCASRRLIVEIDGDSHAAQVEYDAVRTQWLVERGYRVVRFANRDIQRNLSGVLEAILAECEKESQDT